MSIISVENSSVNLEMFFRTMFCLFHVSTVDRLGADKKRTHRRAQYFLFYSIDVFYNIDVLLISRRYCWPFGST